MARDSRSHSPEGPGEDPFAYRSPLGNAQAELKEKGSRFMAFLARTSTEDEAMAFLAALKKRYHDATHHCWAYRLGWGEGLKERCSDAGEPSRTAGPPILSALQASRVSDATLVVVRYFGGVKLGTSGLVRAYRESAALAVGASQFADRTLESEFEVEMPYGAQGSFRHALRRLGLEVASEHFGESWGARLSVPHFKLAPFDEAMGALREAYKGEVRWKSK